MITRAPRWASATAVAAPSPDADPVINAHSPSKEFMPPSQFFHPPQRQLVEPLLQLCGRFRPGRAGGGSPTGLAPIGNGFFNEPGLGIMLSQKLRLAVRQLGEMGFKRVADARVQLLPRAVQQAAMCRVLHQCVLEGIAASGGVPRWKTSSEATRRASAASSSRAERRETTRSSA